MVSQLDNDLINTRSQSHFDSMTPGNRLTHILAMLAENDERISHLLKKDQIDINAFNDEPATGIVTVTNPARKAIMITDILATWNTNQPSFTNSQSNTNSVATPAANAAIASIVVGPGTYQVQWGVEVTAVAATTPDNFKVAINGGTALATSINGTAIGPYPNQPTVIAVGAGSIQTIGVYAIGAEATGTYKATITVTQLNTAASTNPSAKITFGGRTFQCNYSSGIFVASSLHGLQMDATSNANAMTLTVVPAAACHLEFAGYSDYRKIERM